MNLSIYFPPPGFFLADASVDLRLDGTRVYGGSFARGFVASAEVSPGTHTVEARLGFRKRTFTVDVPDGSDDASYVMQLSYSRMWGNFEETFELREGQVPVRVDADPANDDVELPSYPVRATWLVLAVLGVFMALEYLLPVSPREGMSPSTATLDALGGLGPGALRDGELHRLVACTFLHVDPVHLALNGLALAMAGILIERKIGAFWFAVVYGASALGGSFMSLALNDGNTISVGASGAILGLFSAGMVLVEAYPASSRANLRLQLGRVLVPSLLPMLDVHGARVDFGAHLGGAAVGLVVGFSLLGPLKKSAAGTFHSAPVAKALAALSIVAAFVAFVLVGARTYPAGRAKAAVLTTLIPTSELPVKGAPTDDQYEKWAARFPGDPRVSLWLAERALARGDGEGLDRALVGGRAAIKTTESGFTKEGRDAFARAFDAVEADRPLLLLVPNAELPRGSAEEVERGWSEKLTDLSVRFPSDPRVRFELATRAYGKGDFKTALVEIAAARTAEPLTRKFFKTPLELGFLAAIEALALRDLGRSTESRTVALRVCAGEFGDGAKRTLASESMCP